MGAGHVSGRYWIHKCLRAPAPALAARWSGRITRVRRHRRNAEANGRPDAVLGASGISRIRSVGGSTSPYRSARASYCHHHVTAAGCPCIRSTPGSCECAGIRPIGFTSAFPITQILLRRVERRPILAQAAPPVADALASVQTRRVDRHAVSALFPTLPIPPRPFGFDDAGSGFDQSPFTPSVASDVAFAFAQIRERLADRHVIWAQSVSPGAAGLAAVG